MKNRHVCEVCGVAFSRATTYRRHFNSSHTRRVEFKCIMCNKSFARKDILDKHIKKCSSNFNLDTILETTKNGEEDLMKTLRIKAIEEELRQLVGSLNDNCKCL